ncbi:hypothetical protein LSAT2_006420 [Lamellibrachia satsuma]|nr:hypothetical protein LSAT2_006420 [Lamellibrachia satsuma]
MRTNGQPVWVTRTYKLRQSAINKDDDKKETGKATVNSPQDVSLSGYPHRLADIGNLLKEVLGADYKETVYGELKPVGEMQIPSHYGHVIEKASSCSQ